MKKRPRGAGAFPVSEGDLNRLKGRRGARGESRSGGLSVRLRSSGARCDRLVPPRGTTWKFARWAGSALRGFPGGHDALTGGCRVAALAGVGRLNGAISVVDEENFDGVASVAQPVPWWYVGLDVEVE